MTVEYVKYVRRVTLLEYTLEYVILCIWNVCKIN